MLTGQNINYILLPLRKFVLQDMLKKKIKKALTKQKKPKLLFFVACILIRCHPLSNNINIDNDKYDVLLSQCQC